jgi:hypothetical protein
MRTDSAPSTCDVVDCQESATGVYLDARAARLIEFGVCARHFARLQAGERPTVIDQVDVSTPAALLLH